MWNYIWAILIVVVSLGLFILVYALNRKTPRPADCPKDELNEGCGGCMLSCSQRESNFEIKNLISENDDLKTAERLAVENDSKDETSEDKISEETTIEKDPSIDETEGKEENNHE